MNKVKVQFKKLYPDVELPKQAYPGDAGFDVCAHSFDDNFTNIPEKGYALGPNCRGLIKVGFSTAIPEGWEIQVRPRSGLALKNYITVLNSPGTIDSAWRGEIGVIIINHGGNPYYFKKGDKIAQLVIAQVPQVEFEEVEELSPSERGTKGYGSSGK